MPKSPGEPKSIEAQMESSNSEEREEQTDSPTVPQEEEPVPGSCCECGECPVRRLVERVGTSPGLGRTLQTAIRLTDVTPTKEPGTADVYFCGHTSLFPLSRALQAIAKEKLTGLLRSFWEQEPIELLARDGEIIFVTTRDPELYCPETPRILADVDVVIVDRRAINREKRELRFFLLLPARNRSLASQHWN